jgi:hypothetical protein
LPLKAKTPVLAFKFDHLATVIQCPFMSAGMAKSDCGSGTSPVPAEKEVSCDSFPSDNRRVHHPNETDRLAGGFLSRDFMAKSSHKIFFVGANLLHLSKSRTLVLAFKF